MKNLLNQLLGGRNRFEKESNRLLLLILAGAVGIFSLLYAKSLIPMESASQAPASLSEVNASYYNGSPLQEDKNIYSLDSNLYDVYISVFPTPNENGEMLDYSAFSKHKSLDHSYNPLLNCNIQILEEGQKPDPLTSLDSKNATIRVRGNSSRGYSIKNYKVKFDDEAGSFMGQTNLNINKHYKDWLKLTTKLQCDLLAKVDNLASYQTYFMRVWVRDASKPESEQSFEYQGLFTEIEQPNKTYLEKRGLSSRGSLYKAEDFAFLNYDEIRNVDDPAYDQEAFESRLSICTGGEDHMAIIKATEAVNDMNRDFQEVLDQYFNEENILTWIAFSLLMKNNDILNHNYLLYNNGYSDTVYFIPWDLDAALRFRDEVETASPPISQQSIQKLNQSILIRRYLRLNGSLDKIRNKMQELLDGPLSEKSISSLVNSYLPVLNKTLSQTPDIGLLHYEPVAYSEILNKLPEYIKREKQIFDQASEYPSPVFVSAPVLDSKGHLQIAWEPSYSFQERSLKYSVEIYSDYQMKNKLYEKNDLSSTEFTTDQTFKPGTYFLLLKITDSAGNEQLSMEHYEFRSTEGNTIYVPGLLQFTV